MISRMCAGQAAYKSMDVRVKGLLRASCLEANRGLVRGEGVVQVGMGVGPEGDTKAVHWEGNWRVLAREKRAGEVAS